MGTSSSDCVEKKVYTATEVAEMLQWDIRTVYLKCETTTDFKVKRLGPKTVRIDKPSFDAWYDSL